MELVGEIEKYTMVVVVVCAMITCAILPFITQRDKDDG